MRDLSINIDCNETDDFSGHQAICVFVEAFDPDESRLDTDSSTIFLAGQVTAQIFPGESKNLWKSILLLPDSAFENEKVTLRIKAPDGSIVYQQEHSVDKKTTLLKVSSRSGKPAPLNPTGIPSNATAKMRGQIIDDEGNALAYGEQVSIMVSRETTKIAPPKSLSGKEPAGNDLPNMQVLAHTQTDSNGFFTIKYQPESFIAAFIKVGQRQLQPITLVKGGLPEKLIVPVSVRQTSQNADHSDCSCEATVPSLPDTEDFLDSLNVYTSDRAAGCARVNKPNRTIEEFNFFSLVRTTEPEIVGLNLPEPQYIHLDELDELSEAIPPKRPGIRPGFSIAGQGSAATHSTHRAAVTPSPSPSAPTTSQKPPIVDVPKEGPRQFVDPNILRRLANGRAYNAELLSEAVALTKNTRTANLVARAASHNIDRAELTIANPLDWDCEPTFYQATTVAHGHLLQFKQVWKAAGFSLGDLLYSLPLAPGQKRQVAILDWDRTETASRAESLTANDSIKADLTRDRDILEIVSATLTENTIGGSLAVNAGSSSSEGFAGPGSGAASALMMVAGSATGIGGGASLGFQKGSRSTSSDAMQQVRDRIAQSASSVRSQRATVVQSVSQSETLTAQTEVIANYNHCHAITMEYFEVLRHFAVEHNLVDVRECLFVPLLMSPFDKEKALRWREPLKRALKDRKLISSFDALERIVQNYEGEDVPLGSYAEEGLTHIGGKLQVTLKLARPAVDVEAIGGARLTVDSAGWKTVMDLVGTQVVDAIVSPVKITEKDIDKHFADVICPLIAAEIIENIEIQTIGESKRLLPLNAVLTGEFRNRNSLQLNLELSGVFPKNITRQSISDIVIKLRDILPSSLPAGTKVILDAAVLTYQTKHSNYDLLRAQRLAQNLLNSSGVTFATPPTQAELRNPRNEDKAKANALMRHLHDNLEYYHRAIWLGMDPARRFMLLDGITAPNANGRSIASVVENRLIGVVGNSLVLPVVKGVHLDPVYKIDPQNPVSLLEVYQPEKVTAPLLVSVPTKGVFAEAVMGACNSCEKKEENRFWRWEESPIPGEPSAIGLLSTDSRRADSPNLEAKDFAQPIVNIQNVPGVADPTGLSSAMSLLGTANAFRDLTGMDGNQKNAAAALAGALGAAGASGEAASKAVESLAKLQMQKQVSRDGEKIMEAVESAYGRGAITAAQRNEILGGYFKSVTASGQEESPVSVQDYQELMAASAETGVSGVFNPSTGSFEVTPTYLPPPGTATSAATPVLTETTAVSDMGGNLELSTWKWAIEPFRFDEWEMRKDFDVSSNLCREFAFREPSTEEDRQQNPDPDYYLFVPKSAINDDATCKLHVYFHGNPNRNGVSNPVIKYGLRRWAMQNGFILLQIGMKQKPKKHATQLTYARLRHLTMKAWATACQELAPEMFGSTDLEDSSTDAPISETIASAADGLKINTLRLSASSYGIVSLGASLGNGDKSITLAPKVEESSIFASSLSEVVDRVLLFDVSNDGKSSAALKRVFASSPEKIFNYDFVNGPLGGFQSISASKTDREAWCANMAAICCTRLVSDYMRYKSRSTDSNTLSIPKDIIAQLLDFTENPVAISGGPSTSLPDLPSGLSSNFPVRGEIHSGFFAKMVPNSNLLPEYFKTHIAQSKRMVGDFHKPQLDRDTPWPETITPTKASDKIQIGMGAFLIHPNPGSTRDFHYHLIGQQQACGALRQPDKDHRLPWIEGDSGNAGLFRNSSGLIAHGLLISEFAHEMFES